MTVRGKVAAPATLVLVLGGLTACQSGRASGPLPGTRVGYYAAANGSGSGTGSPERPWDLATALAGGRGALQPGDTVWLRGGTYRGAFQTTLSGAAQAPIIFRQYPGERATIDGSLSARGSNLWFWGFEIMQSDAATSATRLLAANTADGRFINLVLHDAGISGVSMIVDEGAGAELYGSIVYNNGHNDNLDHGIYAHNATPGTKYITDNVFFNNCARGIQVYDAGPLIRNFTVTGNVSFDNGTLSCASNRTNLLVSAPATTSGMVIRDNLLYFAPGLGGTQLLLGNYDTLGAGSYNKDIDVENNFAVGGALGLQMRYPWLSAAVRNNVLVGDDATDMVHVGGSTLAQYTWAGNAYYRDPAAPAWEYDGTRYDFGGWRTVTGLGASDDTVPAGPATTRVFVRPNRYEPGRAFVVVYNFADQSAVDADVSGIVTPGDRYEIRNVQDVFNPTPVVAGIYGGGAVSIPMGGVPPPQPIGRSTVAPRTGPAFDVFLLTSGPP